MAGEGSKRTQFVKGKSGNPGGKAKGTSISTILKQMADQDCESDPGKTYVEAAACVITRMALGGDPAFMKMWLDRTEGQAIQRIDMNADVNMIEMIEVVVPPDSETPEADGDNTESP